MRRSSSPWAYLHLSPSEQLPFMKLLQSEVLKNSGVYLSSLSPCAYEHFAPIWHLPSVNCWQTFVFLRFGGSFSSSWLCAKEHFSPLVQWPWVSGGYGEQVRADLRLEERLHVQAALGQLAAAARASPHPQPAHASLLLLLDVARVLVLVHRHVVHVLVLVSVPRLLHRAVLPHEWPPLVDPARTHKPVSAWMPHHLRKRLINFEPLPLFEPGKLMSRGTDGPGAACISSLAANLARGAALARARAVRLPRREQGSRPRTGGRRAWLRIKASTIFADEQIRCAGQLLIIIYYVCLSNCKVASNSRYTQP